MRSIHLNTCCLGNKNDTALMNISDFSDSSSLLNATPLEFEEFGIKKIAEVSVEVRKLSDLIETQGLPVPDLIKLDVQGFELEVLKGAGEFLDLATYLIIEVSFREYYYGQPLFLEITNYLANHGFSIHAFGVSTAMGKELGQMDILFKKK